MAAVGCVRFCVFVFGLVGFSVWFCGVGRGCAVGWCCGCDCVVGVALLAGSGLLACARVRVCACARGRALGAGVGAPCAVGVRWARVGAGAGRSWAMFWQMAGCPL